MNRLAVGIDTIHRLLDALPPRVSFGLIVLVGRLLLGARLVAVSALFGVAGVRIVAVGVIGAGRRSAVAAVHAAAAVALVDAVAAEQLIVAIAAVLAWGDNDSCQVGNGTDKPSLVPIPVPSFGGVKTEARELTDTASCGHSLASVSENAHGMVQLRLTTYPK